MRNSKLKQKTQGFGKIKNAVCRKSVGKKAEIQQEIQQTWETSFVITCGVCEVAMIWQSSATVLVGSCLNESFSWAEAVLIASLEGTSKPFRMASIFYQILENEFIYVSHEKSDLCEYWIDANICNSRNVQKRVVKYISDKYRIKILEYFRPW